MAKITVVEKAMNEQEVAADAGCTLLEASLETCSATSTVTKERAGTTCSSYYNSHHYYANLDSWRSWCAAKNDQDQWLAVPQPFSPSLLLSSIALYLLPTPLTNPYNRHP